MLFRLPLPLAIGVIPKGEAMQRCLLGIALADEKAGERGSQQCCGALQNILLCLPLGTLLHGVHVSYKS